MPPPTEADSATFETLEDWALAYVTTTSLHHKVAPPALPTRFGDRRMAAPAAPGRPAELRVVRTAPRTPRPGALRRPEARARLLHTFWHHELQAAELMCWAALRFSDADPQFRRGLLGICLDEIRHMSLYAARIADLGWKIGDFPVRDWFWRRVPSCDTQAAFVALLGMGLEAANLEHARDFAERFRQAGDPRAAAIMDRVGQEEVAHVAFGTHWFRRLTGGCDFETWRRALPAPLSPLLMRGAPLARDRRLAAGMDASFVEDLDRWQPSG